MRDELKQTAWPWLSPEQRRAVECHVEFIDLLGAKIEELDRIIEERSDADPAASLLRSIPGIGPFRSLLLVAEIMPIARFPWASHLVSFAGLAPTVRQSGLKDPYRGRLPRGANRWVRGHSSPRCPATARRLCRAIHAMLRNGELWRG